MSNFKVVIPARFASERLPGKPLRDIAGRPMIEHVWRRAGESGASEVVIATDDKRIADAAEHFGALVALKIDDDLIVVPVHQIGNLGDALGP